MSELSQGAPDLDTRLAEIDRKLREIQAELVPGREPAPHRGRTGPLATILERARQEPPERGPEHLEQPRTPELTHQIVALTEVHAKILSSMRELLDAYESVLTQMSRSASAPERPDAGEPTVSAGPFASTEAMRAFERTLAVIPGVREVAVRGYEGEDRAILDVRLSERRS